MKGLLYKEFASRKNFIFLLLLILAMRAGLSLLQSSDAAYIVIWAICIILPSYGLSIDEKSGWNNFSRVLPQSAHKRVGAQYVMWFIMLVITLFAAIAVTAISTNFEINKYYQMQITYLWKEMFLPKVYFNILMFCLATVFLAVQLLLNYLVKHTVRIVLTAVTASLGYLALLGLILIGYLRNDAFVDEFCQPSVAVMITAAALILFAASYLFSVIAETKSGREKLKATKAAAAILVVGALTVSGITVYVLDKKGAFDFRENPQTDYIGSADSNDFYYYGDEESLEDAIVAKAEARLEVTELIDAICGKTFAGKTKQEIDAELKISGSADDWEILSCYLGERDSFTESKSFSYYNLNIGSTNISSADESKINYIRNSFVIGMSEKEAADVMELISFYPDRIYESLSEGKPYRTYRGEFLLDSYEGEENVPFSLNIEIIDGVVNDVRTYIRLSTGWE